MSSLILLVESEDDVARRVRTVLHEASHRVISCSSGPEGSSLAYKHAPEFVLIGRLTLRHELGGLLESIRHHPLTATAPVLFIPRPGSSEFDSYLERLPRTLEEVRPAEDSWAGSPDLGVLPPDVRNGLAQVLGSARQLTREANRMPLESSQALGATLREAGRMLDRLGLFILTRPEPRSDRMDTDFSTRLMLGLGAYAAKTSRAEALHLSLLPCLWSEDDALIDALGETVELLLVTSSAAVSLRPAEDHIAIKLIAPEYLLPVAEAAAMQQAARRHLDEPVSLKATGRFGALVRLLHERAWPMRIHAGEDPGVKLEIEIPYWPEGERSAAPSTTGSNPDAVSADKDA